MMSTKRIAPRINSIQLNLVHFSCVQFSWTQLNSAQFVAPSSTHDFNKYFLDIKVYVGIGGPAGVAFTNWLASPLQSKWYRCLVVERRLDLEQGSPVFVARP